MAYRFTNIDICEEAVRRVRGHGSYDVSADELDIDVAKIHLDMILSDLAATERLFALEPINVPVTLAADDPDYTLDASNSSYPQDGVVSPISASLFYNGSRRGGRLKFYTRRQYEALNNKAESGTPCAVWLDYLKPGDPILYVHPVPAVTGYSLDLTVQTWTPTLYAKTGQEQAFSDEQFVLRQGWARWAVNELSAVLGDGFLTSREDSEVKRWMGTANYLKSRLLASANREYVRLQDRRVAYQRNP